MLWWVITVIIGLGRRGTGIAGFAFFLGTTGAVVAIVIVAAVVGVVVGV